MDDLCGHIAEFVARIWEADTRIRGGSSFGESKFERSGRWMVAWTCGTIIAILVAAMLFLAWRN